MKIVMLTKSHVDDVVFSSATKVRALILTMHLEIEKRKKQNFNCRKLSKRGIRVADTVRLRNNRRFDLKGQNSSQKWLGLFAVTNITH